MSKTFLNPNEMVRDPNKGYAVVDKEKSEDFRLLEAIGTPRIFYAVKANKYFKDVNCTKEFSDEELLALELPIPAEIENQRRKLIRAANDAGKPADFAKIYDATTPKEVLPPKGIRERIVSIDPIEKMINKINRATLGK